MATTFWRLAGRAVDLGLTIEKGDGIRFTHGDVTVLLEEGGLVVAQIALDTPEPVYERLLTRAEAEDSQGPAPEPSPLDLGGGPTEVIFTPFTNEDMNWLFEVAEVRAFAADVKHRLEYAAFRPVQLIRWICGLVLASLPKAVQQLTWSLDDERW